MDEWVVIKEVEPEVNTQPFLLHINRERLKALEKADYQVWLEVRNARDESVLLHETRRQLAPSRRRQQVVEGDEERRSTGNEYLLTQTDHAEGSVDKSTRNAPW